MPQINKVYFKKSLLSFSVAAFFLLFSGYEPQNYVFGLLFIPLAGILIFRSKGISLQLEQPIAPRWIILAGLFAWAVSETRQTVFWIHRYELSDWMFSLVNVESNFVGLITNSMAVISVPALAFFLCWFWQTVTEDFRNASSDKAVKKTLCAWKAWGLLFLVYLLGISALVRSDFLYVDDFSRNAKGIQDWEGFSRFLSCDLSTLFQLNTFLTDLSPLTQYVSIALVALSGIILLYVVFERTSFTVWEVLALVPLGLNPYFLECLSYKFDSPYMAVSIFCAVFPLLLRKKSPLAYIISIAVGTVMLLTSYQAASGIFPMIVVLLALRMYHRNESWNEIICFCVKSAMGFALGLLYFRLVMMLSIVDYGSTNLPGIAELLPNFLRNIKAYFLTVKRGFPTRWENLCIILFFAFWATSVFSSRRSFLSAALMTGIAFGMMLMLTFGIYPALAQPTFYSRALFGFGVLLTLLCITTAESNHSTWFRVPELLLSLVFFTFAFTYGNALSDQKEYTAFRAQQIITDLSQGNVFQDDAEQNPTDQVYHYMQVDGSIGFAPSVLLRIDEYPVLSSLVPIMLSDSTIWGVYPLMDYYGLPETDFVFFDNVDLRTMDLPVVADTLYHTIRSDGHNVLISLK